MNDIVKYIEKHNLGDYEADFRLANKTTYKTGGEVRVFIEPYDVEVLTKLIKFIKKRKYKYFIIGNGSNVIIPDEKSDVIVIKLNKLDQIDINVNSLTVGAGAVLPKLANDTALRGISCFEFASGIPGTVGGGVYMNAGAYGKEFKDCLLKATVLNVNTLELEELTNEQLSFSYRKSFLQEAKHYIVINATFTYTEANPSHILDVIKTRRERRVETQPVSKATAGSVFKNPEGLAAWKLIDEAGLRGCKIGGAMVSEKHCNMIVNTGNATSKDIVKLIDYVKEVVKQRTGVELKTEQKIVEW